MVLTVVLMTAKVAFWLGVDLDRVDTLYLAKAVYCEARGEPVAGQIAVAKVVLNRVDAGRGSITDVVTEPGQFAYDCHVREADAWEGAVEVAALTMAEAITVNPAGGAVHFYAPADADPFWARTMEEVAVIGGHRFLQ